MSKDLPAHADHAQAASKSIAIGLAFAVVGAIAFSGKAIIVKLAYRYGVDAVTLIMYRMLLALPFFLVMAWWAGRGRPPLTWRDWAGVVGLGFSGYYLSSMLDFAGLQYISASLERLILYLSPTLVLLLNWRIKAQTVSRAQWLAMAVSYAGALLVFGVEMRTVPSSATAWGAFLVLLSTVSYAIYLFYSGEYVQRLGALRLGGWATAVACMFCIAQFVLLRPMAAALVAPEVVWLSLLNATLCTAAPVLLVMMAIERIGPVLTAQVGILGPLATIAMGIVLLGEPFTPWLMAGTVLVMVGIYLFSRAGRVGR